MGQGGSQPKATDEGTAAVQKAAASTAKARRAANSHDYLLASSPAHFERDFVGLINVRVEEADIGVHGHYSVTMSLGLQSFVSKTSSKSSRPVFNAERNFAVMRSGSSKLHFVIHKVKRSKLGVLSPSIRGVHASPPWPARDAQVCWHRLYLLHRTCSCAAQHRTTAGPMPHDGPRGNSALGTARFWLPR